MEILDVLNEYGEFIGKTATREECHKNGYWHRAVYAFIIDDKWNVLLQKRSGNKKLWPNIWDVPVGGHVDSGEFGRQALIRETKEELGIEISEVKYFSKEDLIKRIDNNYEGLTRKTGPWNFLKVILEKYSINNN
mgnify:CR=1 FL=1